MFDVGKRSVRIVPGRKEREDSSRNALGLGGTDREEYIYLAVDGNLESANTILELREMIGSVDNRIKEESSDAMLDTYKGIAPWVHDNVCACDFSKALARWRMLDRFHERNHTRAICRTTLNPNTPSNCKIRYRSKCTNTSARDQISRYMNRHSTAQRLGKLNYRAFWRHACMFYNACIALRTPQSCSITRPAISRRLTLKTIRRRL